MSPTIRYYSGKQLKTYLLIVLVIGGTIGYLSPHPHKSGFYNREIVSPVTKEILSFDVGYQLNCQDILATSMETEWGSWNNGVKGPEKLKAYIDDSAPNNSISFQNDNGKLKIIHSNHFQNYNGGSWTNDIEEYNNVPILASTDKFILGQTMKNGTWGGVTMDIFMLNRETGILLWAHSSTSTGEKGIYPNGWMDYFQCN